MNEVAGELAERVKALKVELKLNEAQWQAAYDERLRLEKEGERLKADLHSTTLEWLKTQPPIAAWKYWVKWAKEWDVAIFYSGADDIQVLDLPLDAEDREEYGDEEFYTRATARDVPDDDIIMAVGSACQSYLAAMERP
jgi:hypothetical protein